MTEPRIRQRFFLFSLAPASAGRLSTNTRRPYPSNLHPLRIRVQPCARRTRHGKRCQYVANYSPGAAPLQGARCVIQIWELDRWTRGRGRRERRRRGTEQDAQARDTSNELLREIEGTILQTGRRTYRFVVNHDVATGQRPADRALGWLNLKVDRLTAEHQIEADPTDIIVPLQGEVETRLEVGVAHREDDEQLDYANTDFPLPVYHVVNISKVIEDQLDEGGLRVLMYVNYNRRIDDRAHAHYRRVRRQLLQPDTTARRQQIHVPTQGHRAPSVTLRAWLTSLGDLYTGNTPPAATTSARTLYSIQNDKWFPNGSRLHAKMIDALCLTAANEIAIGRFQTLGHGPIAGHFRRLLDEVHRQHMDSAGDHPKVLKFGIWCHGIRRRLNTRGRDPAHNQPQGGDQGQHLTIARAPAFVRSLVIREGDQERKLLADSAILGLYACNAARSSFTPGGTNSDSTYGDDPPDGHMLGEGSIALALKEELRRNSRFPGAVVWGHTTRGPADTNPYLRVFTITSHDLLNLVYDDAYQQAHANHWQTYRQAAHRDSFREVMLLEPGPILPGAMGPADPNDPIVQLRNRFQ